MEIEGLFFINDTAIKETRTWPEALTIDATYKTNSHKMSLVNVVGTSNATSEKSSERLQTFAVAAGFVNNEKEETYTWILEELRDAVWPKETNYKLPSVIVTDNEQALRNAIESVFPESQHLLCSWHLWNTMSLKQSAGMDVDNTTFNYRRAQAEEIFKSIMSSYDDKSYQKAIGNFESFIATPGYFSENGAPASKYLKETQDPQQPSALY